MGERARSWLTVAFAVGIVTAMVPPLPGGATGEDADPYACARNGPDERPRRDRGYWVVGGDGGVFSYGQAPFLGSAGGDRPVPVVDIEVDALNSRHQLGYWLVAADGEIFAFGSAVDQGSPTVGKGKPPIVGMALGGRSGYWMADRAGRVFAFNTEHLGSAAGTALNQPVMGLGVCYGVPEPSPAPGPVVPGAAA